MTELALSAAEPFTSPAWGSNFVVFTSASGAVISENLVKSYLTRACKYAKHYGVYLVPERFMLMDFQCMALISPDGEVIGSQKGIYLNMSQNACKRGSGAEVFKTEFGNIFLCVDADVYYPEVCRIAANSGADIIVTSQFIPKEDFDNHLVVTGTWNVAQSNNVYTVSVSNQFNCVCAPLALSPHGDGFINTPGFKLPMISRIHADKLLAVPPYPVLSRPFYAVHKSELIG